VANLTSERRRGLALDAQVSIIDSASRVWGSVRGFPSASIAEVKFGGVRLLARKLAAAAIAHGAPEASVEQLASQQKLAEALKLLTKRQRTQVFVDALVGYRAPDKGNKTPRISPITAYPYPSAEQPSEPGSGPHIRVERTSRVGGAALVVSLWRPQQAPAIGSVEIEHAGRGAPALGGHTVDDPDLAVVRFQDWP
jgi:hypothetical protein